MTRMPVRVLESVLPIAEVHPPRDARIDHPLQRAVDCRAADPRVFAANQRDQFVGAEMSALAQEDVDDDVAFARTASAARAPRFDEFSGSQHGGPIEATTTAPAAASSSRPITAAARR